MEKSIIKEQALRQNTFNKYLAWIKEGHVQLVGKLLLIAEKLGSEPPAFKQLKKESFYPEYLTKAYHHYTKVLDIPAMERTLHEVNPSVRYLEEEYIRDAKHIIKLLATEITALNKAKDNAQKKEKQILKKRKSEKERQ